MENSLMSISWLEAVFRGRRLNFSENIERQFHIAMDRQPDEMN